MKNISSLIFCKLALAAAAVLMPAALTPANALSYPATDSPLSAGRWVKIKVTNTGMHQITFDQLRQWGFDDPENVHVYGYGGALYWNNFKPAAMPEDLPLQYSEIDGDRIVFYGESEVRPGLEYLNTLTAVPRPERNLAADAGYYFLSDRPATQTTSKVALLPPTTTVSSHQCVSFIEEEVSKPSDLGLLYFGRMLTEYDDNTFSTDLNYVDRVNSSKVILQFPMAVTEGVANNPAKALVTLPGYNSTHKVYLDKPNEALHKIIFTTGGTSAYRYYQYVPRFSTDEQAGQLKITPDPTGGTQKIYLDYVAVAYTRRNDFANAQNGQMRMLFTQGSAGNRIVLFNATESTRIWDVSSAHAVAPMELSEMDEEGAVQCSITDDFTLTAYVPARAYIAFDSDTGFYDVEYDGEVTNSNLHAMEVPEFLIITTKLLRDQAERLAELHRVELGQKVAVVELPEIYNEFSSGTPSLNGIRRFIGKLYFRPGAKLTNVLLFGPGSNDLRGIGKSAPFVEENNLLPTYATTDYDYLASGVDGFASDSYFGRPGETMGSEKDFFKVPPFIGVGRIPAYTREEATKAVDKIEEYLTVPPTVDAVNRTLVLTDPAERLSHAQNGESVARAINSGRSNSTIVKAHVSLYPLVGSKSPGTTAAISQALRSGVNFLDFSGHGAFRSLTKKMVWTDTDVYSTSYNCYPVAFFATCENYPYDKLERGMSDIMMLQPNGGTIASIGAGRRTWTVCNQAINSTAGQIYANAEPGYTIGEFYRDIQKAHTNSSMDGMDRIIYGYNLCGDPALPIRIPETDKINPRFLNDNTINPGLEYRITPLTPTRLTGQILTAKNGEVDTEFNGTIYFNLHEQPRKQEISDNDASDLILLDSDVLVTVEAPVVNGEFTLNFTCPLPSRINPRGSTSLPWHNRATMLAVSDDNKRYYSNNVDYFLVNDEVPAEIAEVAPPSINKIYINTPDFVDGDAVDSEFTLFAHLTPGPGAFKMTSGNIGGSPTFTIDQSRTIQVVAAMMSTQPDGSVVVRIPVNSVADGRHSGQLMVSDNYGNLAEANINFTVSHSSVTAHLTMEETVARVQATFGLNHTFTDAPAGRLVVEDSAGNVVWSTTDCSFPAEWDLTGRDGKPVADGVYHAYAILHSGIFYATTPKLTVTVVQATR